MKIAVIGASMPGLFAAHLLAKHGLEVEVYERAAEVGTPARTLIVTEKINEVLGFYPKEAILNQAKRLELFSRSRSVRLELERPDLIVERGALIRLLARMAESQGAKLKLSRRFLSYVETADGLAIGLKNLASGEVEYIGADLLIGADGAFSSVARAARRNGHALASLLQARVALPAGLARDTFQVWFNTTRTKYFFWLIPESDETAAVGLIADDARQAGASLKSFLDERGLEPIEFQGAMVPMHNFDCLPRIAGDKIFLAGDAAAHVKVTTVGGVVTGLRGARAVAQAIIKGKNWRREIMGLKLELDLHLLLRRMLHSFGDHDYDALIGMLDGRLQRILTRRTRDELARTFLKLIAAEPRLLALGAKALLKSLAAARLGAAAF